MSTQKTLLEAYVGEDFLFTIEKWFIADANSPMESYTGVAINYIEVESGEVKAALLSKDRAKKLIDLLQKAVGISNSKIG